MVRAFHFSNEAIALLIRVGPVFPAAITPRPATRLQPVLDASPEHQA
jgi:hypothetical protein